MENRDCCFKNILRVIDVLQRNANICETIEESCSKPFLGNFSVGDVYNTRPVTFYSKCGRLYEVPYTINGITYESSTFRVEKVKDCCVTLQILAPNADTSRPYIATNQYVTINLECVCVLQCLPDVIVDNV